MSTSLPLPLLSPPLIAPLRASHSDLHETSFFRDTHTFDAIRDVLLPEAIERNSAARTLRIWSAGCSTGQEPYSLAMLIAEHFPELAGWDVQILGTDISSDALRYARHGCYKRMEINRGLPARLVLNYFERDGESWRLDPRVRRVCRFETMDLCATPSSLPRFDLILLRNVLHYLPAVHRSQVFATLHRSTRSSGFLVLGDAEQAEDFTALFIPELGSRHSFYRPSTSPLGPRQSPGVARIQ